ncbi:tetrapyrrole biosynthesis, uroporphyrinogen III synthase [Ophiobolus disseminans]|uniref:Tetrapyrrole biosynthesis, uroporphyrinogen III synthase n=1 Tax=Ophiobolus disseminans TaxID=1469910 RepID=A0A6A6ZFN9_9PLEO|nr:tetrapyrrole biosynthesis, uroporphyrinogen III synthase [Ophiobolus disseminans]
MAEQSRGKVPLLLLKTKSVPTDTYEELFITLDNHRYAPVFVPVLEHRFKRDALDEVRTHVTNHGFVPAAQQGLATYGALIFTSQRAVEAFTEIVEEVRKEGKHVIDHLLPQSLPMYVVGPATARGLRELNLPCPILGEHTGNGEALAAYMLEHYNEMYPGASKPSILFLVGDKRRDIIPKTMQAANLSDERRCKVDELVIYETGEMQSFRDNFSALWGKNVNAGCDRQWIVVFSPTGCQAMLESLGLLDTETGRGKPSASRNAILVATIGPTTRDYLEAEFGFSPDVCAEKPSPEGIAEGIRSFEIKYSKPPAKSDDAVAGSKRKPDAQPSPARSRKTTKKQATLEESGITTEDSEMKDASDQDGEKSEGKDASVGASDSAANTDAISDDVKAEENDSAAKVGTTNDDGNEVGNDSAAKVDPSKNSAKPESNGDTIEESSQREAEIPSNILEKGLIYFFTRNRVGIDDAESVGDLQRTFFVLRPLPTGAKLGDGAIPDLKNNRLFALPKKTFPKSHNDKFMSFVEKANTTIQDLKDNFFSGSSYETKTQGTRQVDPVTPVAEGVYAITRTEDRTTHLVYSTTIPSDLGELQEDLGIKDQGSFIISVKNPERSGPAASQLPQKPDFSKEIIEEFRGLAWSEVKPKYLDHEYCQILLIGEHLESGVEPTKKDQKHDKETPQEELEKLEHEDELRVKHLNGDDSVFDDLKLSKKDYPKVPTTW